MSSLVCLLALAMPPREVLLADPRLIGLPTASGRPEYIRDQGSRGACTMFSAVAALEYAVLKTYGEVVDLSEQFTNHVGKMMWLHAEWREIPDVRTRENQAGGTQGGAYLGTMADGMAIPREEDHPWGGFIRFRPGLDDPVWNSQLQVNRWNHDPRNLPLSALDAPFHYFPTGFQELSDPKDPTAMERVLDSGWPVVWDFDVAGDRSGSVWVPSTAPSIGGHSMLIVGYDNGGTNDDTKFFWVKNSWGPTRERLGLTRISYSYLRRYGIKANTLRGVRKEKKREYLSLGNWQLTSRDRQLTLDISHLPGLSKYSWAYYGKTLQRDLRLGSLYTTIGAPTPTTPTFRVNGRINTRSIDFYYSPSEPNFSYWAGAGQANGRFTVMPGGRWMTGYLETGLATLAFLGEKGGPPPARPIPFTTLPSAIGSWDFLVRDRRGVVLVGPKSADELAVSATLGSVRLRGTARWENPSTVLRSVRFLPTAKQLIIRLTPDTRMTATEDLWLNSLVLVGDQVHGSLGLVAGLTGGSEAYILARRSDGVPKL